MEFKVRERLEFDHLSEHCCGEGIIVNNYCTHDVDNNGCKNVYNHNVLNTDNCNQLLGKTNTCDMDNWSVDRMLAKLFDTDGNQTHLLWYNMSGDHSNLSDCYFAEVKTITLTLLNISKRYHNQWVQIVYIQDTEMEVSGYYERARGTSDSICSLVRCDHLPEGYLQVIGNIDCQIIEIQYKDNQRYTNVKTEARLAYDNYCQDLNSWQQYGCDYDSYVDQVIDQLIKYETELELSCESNGNYDTGLYITVNSSDNQGNKTESGEASVVKPTVSRFKLDRSQVKDFNYSDKTRGYLAQASTNFVFIGPDRHPIQLDSVDTLLKTASIIRDTGQPNYKVARIPIESGLNVAAWEKYLENYSDKRIIQYIVTLTSVFPYP